MIRALRLVKDRGARKAKWDAGWREQDKMSDLSELHGCRDATATEIEHFATFGWVKLEQFVSAKTAEALLHEAQRRMGLDGDSNPLGDPAIKYFNSGPGKLLQTTEFNPLLKSIGRNARLLMARGDSTAMRLFADNFAAKLPARKDAQHIGRDRTDYHQDFPTMGLDRAGGMTTWIALTDLSPEFGTMDFLNGSHRIGVLGAHPTFPPGHELTDVYPGLLERCPSSGPITYRAGDATVHSLLCVHGAGQNFTNDPRWNFFMSCVPADSCWNGAPAGKLFSASVAAGLEPFQQLDDMNFPLLTD